MSQQYDNTNRGVLFKNKKKTEEKHPDYTGSINIAGTEHFLDAWIKEGQNGKFMSVKIGSAKTKQPAKQAAPQSTQAGADAPADDWT